MTQHRGARPIVAGAPAGGDVAVALAYFDSLPAVTVEELLGAWRGREWPTGHPMDGLLERFGWYGKRFTTLDDVQPLLFDTGRGAVALNPRWVPFGLLLRVPRLCRAPGSERIFRAVLPLLTTRRPQARLRMTEYRGVVSATLCYDRQPIHDVFRRIDEHTLLGAMELRGSAQPFLFLLTRSPGAVRQKPHP